MAPITKLPNSTKPKLKGDTHSRSAELLVQAHPSMIKCWYSGLGNARREDIERFAGARVGPGTLYGAITRLEQVEKP